MITRAAKSRCRPVDAWTMDRPPISDGLPIDSDQKAGAASAAEARLLTSPNHRFGWHLQCAFEVFVAAVRTAIIKPPRIDNAARAQVSRIWS